MEPRIQYAKTDGGWHNSLFGQWTTLLREGE